MIACSGSPEVENKRRAALRQQFVSFDTTHSLAVDSATDYVVCSICNGNKHPKEWKSFARTRCPGKTAKPTESSGGTKRKAELREQFMKKRGRSAPSAPE